MKKIITLTMLMILCGLMLNCGQAPPPPNAFRLKTRIKFRLFGSIPLFHVALPFQKINLKTNTAPGTAGTIGTKQEFNPGGQYVTTDVVGKFDAVEAVLPASWTVKADPNQIIRFPCQYAASETFQATAGSTQRYRCNLDVLNRLISTPRSLYVNTISPPPPSNLNGGIHNKGFSNQALFSNANNVSVHYYRYNGLDEDGDEKYELESVKAPTFIEGDGTAAKIPYPSGLYSRSGYLVNNRTKQYHIVYLEDNIYVGHTEFQIDYPELNCERSRTCN